jgi:hypothetical protein
LEIDTTAVDGLYLEETIQEERRTIKLSGALAVGDVLPDGDAGDMLYNNGTAWVVLPAPSAPSSGEIVVLTHSGTAPVWSILTEQSLDICDAGTPSTITVLTQ